MANSDKQLDHPFYIARSDAGLIAKFDRAPGVWATFARNALHEVTCGWHERVGASGENARRSREAGSRAHPVAALAGGLVPQLALGVITGGLSATPLAQGAMAASRSLAESPEDLSTLQGLKAAVPRASLAAGTALALAKGAEVFQRALRPTTEYVAAKTWRPLLARLRAMSRDSKWLVRSRQIGSELPKMIFREVSRKS
jgi:hypothetical protein